MKFSRLALLIFIPIFFLSCGSDDENSLQAPEGQLAARIDGKVWASVETQATIDQERISIAVINAKGDNIAIVIGATSTGNYDVENLIETNGKIPDHVVAYTPFEEQTFTTAYDIESAGGTFSITELDIENKFVSGTYDVTVAAKIDIDTDTLLMISQAVFNRIPLQQGNTNVGVGGNTVEVKVDGVSFAPTVIGGAKAFGKIVLSFSNALNQSIALTIPDDIKSGTYNLGGLSSTYSASFLLNATTSRIADSGNLTITKHDVATKRIEGTFNFEASPITSTTPVSSVSEGKFEMTYN